GGGEHERIHYFAMQFVQGQGRDGVMHEVSRLRRARTSHPGGPAEAPPPAREAGRGPDLSASLAGGLLTGRFPGKEEDHRPADKPGIGQPDSEPGLSGSTSEVLAGKSGFGTRSDAQYFRSVARVGIQVAEALAY